MIRNVIKSICMFAVMASVSRAEIIYSNPTDVHVTGTWEFSGDDSVLVAPMNFPIDLNHDGANDVSINHHFVRRVNRIERDAFELLQMANLGQREVFSLLKEARSIALVAANEGVNDADMLKRFQIQLDSKLDRINRISETTAYNGQKLLDGSAGMMGTASNSNVTVLNVADTVQPGTYAFNVDTSGARATTLTKSALVSPLGQEETLAINGVKVELYAGMTGTQVQDRINLFTDQTGVTGHIVRDGFDAGKLRFSGVAFGHASNLDIISNVAQGTADSSSVGTTLIEDHGVDVVATIGGIQFNGHGNTVTADSGLGRGLSLAVSPVDSADNHHLTFAGQLGVIDIQDQSLSFPLTATQDEAINIALRTLTPAALESESLEINLHTFLRST